MAVYELESKREVGDYAFDGKVEALIKKSAHYHYLITFSDREEPREIARVIEIRDSKPNMNYVQELERKHRFAKVLSITELECNCEKS